MKGLLLVVSGPSGVGKGTVCQHLLKFNDIVYSISATTRKPRPGEKHGEDYIFLCESDFLKQKKEEQFLEWAEVYNNYYGTPKKSVDELLKKGKNVILEIDTDGAQQIKKTMPDSVLIYVLPPSYDELARRLKDRKTETEKVIKMRLGKFKEELKSLSNYDYAIVNDDAKKAADDMHSIINAEKCKISYIIKNKKNSLDFDFI